LCELTGVLIHKKQNSGYPSTLCELTGVLIHKKQNSGNQPEFQSSIKKRTVIETVVTFNILRNNYQILSRKVKINNSIYNFFDTFPNYPK